MRDEIQKLKRLGYQVEKLTPYQFRIESVLDLYPKRRRFHNIANQKRGQYPLESLSDFVDEQVKAADEILDKAIASGQLDDLGAASDDRTYRRRHIVDKNPIWWTKYTKDIA